VKIVPQYESYRFFILASGRIVIVDPDAPTIVYIIEAWQAYPGGVSRAAGPAGVVNDLP